MGVGVGVGVGTFTPLLQTSFLPDLMHLYLYPVTEVVAFNLVQADPALTAAMDGDENCDASKEKQSRSLAFFITAKG